MQQQCVQTTKQKVINYSKKIGLNLFMSAGNDETHQEINIFALQNFYFFIQNFLIINK